MICGRQYEENIAGYGRLRKHAGAMFRGAGRGARIGKIPLEAGKRSSTAGCGVHCVWPNGVLRKWSTTGLMGKTALEG